MKTAVNLDAQALANAPALSVRQPWANLIVAGRKSVELRTWSAPHRGPLWIHAGKARAAATFPEALQDEEEFYGGVIGLVCLDAIVPMTADRWEQWRDGHLCSGPFPGNRFAWLLSGDVKLPRPIPVQGNTLLFHLPEPALQEAIAQLAAQKCDF